MTQGFLATHWVFVRHAPINGHEGRYVGQLDLPAQPVAPQTAQRLRQHIPAEAVWLCSPLSRTRAAALALKGHQQPIEVPDFMEQNFGDWQGRSYNDVYRAHGGLTWDDPAAIKPPEGESFVEMAVRIAAAIDRLSDHYQGQTLAAAVHAGTIRAAIGHALVVPPSAALRFEIAPLSMTRLTRLQSADETLWQVGCINQVFD